MIPMNQLKTALLLAALTALLLIGGHVLAGRIGLVAAVVFAVTLNFGAYWFSDRMILRMHGAREIRPADGPALHSMVRDLAHRANIPAPRIYLLDDAATNAFATGRDPKHGAIALTDGLLRALTRDELAGVIAHEIGHIQRRDTLIMTVAAALAGALGFIAHFTFWNRSGQRAGGGLFAILAGLLLAPLAATLIQAAISRSREFLADEAGARLVGNPLALAAALTKIEAASLRTPLRSATSASAHLFIRNPMSGSGWSRLFQTHPPTRLRIERLETMALRRVAQEV